MRLPTVSGISRVIDVVLFKTGNCAEFQRFCTESPDVIGLYRISGKFNFTLKATAESPETLTAFLDSSSPNGFPSKPCIPAPP
ncbi:Lrp/AsnC ligand binding domain-containing protein [Paenibacillus doosanensis]|uniref:Lrp/AsnC ligand binding domain-containing protein n=1 Tax=Paenibacillus doosanensis TaxID=1229154 RepID=UPI00217FEC8D|nr:Lrp/AsnC ligand binding domain-containing protein [Paenibacillus doosanensis]